MYYTQFALTYTWRRMHKIPCTAKSGHARFPYNWASQVRDEFRIVKIWVCAHLEQSAPWKASDERGGRVQQWWSRPGMEDPLQGCLKREKTRNQWHRRCRHLHIPIQNWWRLLLASLTPASSLLTSTEDSILERSMSYSGRGPRERERDGRWTWFFVRFAHPTKQL